MSVSKTDTTVTTNARPPLDGLRVVELADETSEYCGLMLMGLGAEVIKI